MSTVQRAIGEINKSSVVNTVSVDSSFAEFRTFPEVVKQLSKVLYDGVFALVNEDYESALSELLTFHSASNRYSLVVLRNFHLIANQKAFVDVLERLVKDQPRMRVSFLVLSRHKVKPGYFKNRIIFPGLGIDDLQQLLMQCRSQAFSAVPPYLPNRLLESVVSDKVVAQIARDAYGYYFGNCGEALRMLAQAITKRLPHVERLLKDEYMTDAHIH